LKLSAIKSENILKMKHLWKWVSKIIYSVQCQPEAKSEALVCEPLGELKACSKQWTLWRHRNVWDDKQVRMSDGCELQTACDSTFRRQT